MTVSYRDKNENTPLLPHAKAHSGVPTRIEGLDVLGYAADITLADPFHHPLPSLLCLAAEDSSLTIVTKVPLLLYNTTTIAYGKNLYTSRD